MREAARKMTVLVTQKDERCQMSQRTSHDDLPDAAVPPRIVVLGLGNSLLADDGVGVQAIAQLQSDPAGLPLELIDGGTMNFTLLQYLEDAAAMIVIDAANLDAKPGTVRVFEGEAMDRIVAGSRRNSVHEAGLADLMGMARLKDCLPARRALITVQPERIDWGETLSASVQRALPGICERARLLAARWAADTVVPEPAS
jgi:hydrogenase maturation protease